MAVAGLFGKVLSPGACALVFATLRKAEASK